MNFPFIKFSRVYYVFSGILIIAAIASLIMFGLKFGIEFTGGSNMEVEFTGSRPNNDQIVKALDSFKLGDIVVQPTGSAGDILQFKGVDEATHQKILAEINKLSPVQEKSFQFIGPSIGQELKNKTIIAILLSLLAITAYIAFAFRKVSRPVASWKYGITSLIALFHDILIPLGVFAVLGKFYGVVIFDRIRENLQRSGMSQFQETVDRSLNQTVGRSVSTVVTVLLVMASLYFFGGETLKYFSLALIIGITSGAYSSIFIASPLLVSWQKWSERRAK